MKKKLALCLSLLSIIGLAGCNGGSESGKGSDLVVPPTSDKVEEDVNKSIKFTQSEVEIERSSTKTVRVNTSALTTDDKTVIFSSEEDGKIIQLADQGSGDVAIKIKGLRIGKATLKAVSVANKNIIATVTINVVAQKSALRSVWNNVIKSTNYTLSSFNPDISGEEPSSVVKVTDKAVVAVDKDGKSLITSKMQLSADSEEAVDVSLYGIAISNNDLAYYIVQKDDGSFFTPEISITSAVGLLRQSNFLGSGKNADSFLDVGSFYGLQAVNPNWLTNVKNEDNTYEILGSEEDTNSAYAEALLWGLVDPNGKEDLLMEKYEGSYTAPEAADLIDTTVTVVDNSTVSIQITEVSSQKTHIAYLSDKGTTELPSEVSAYVAQGAASVAKPTISSGLTDIINTFKKNDYSIYQNLTYGEYYYFYAPTYYWNGVTTEIAASYKTWAEKQGYTGDKLILPSGGYVALSDGIYEFTLTENFDEKGKKTDPTVVIGDSPKTHQTNKIEEAIGYFSLVDAFQDDSDDIYTFRALQAQNGGTTYYSTLSSVSDQLSYIYFGGFTLKQLVDELKYDWGGYGTSLTATYAKDKVTNKSYVSAVEIGLGTFGMKGQMGYMFPAKVVTESCTKTNPYDAAITAAIAARKA